MEAKNLRIGNLIGYFEDNDDTNGKIFAAELEDLADIDLNGYSENYKPIPLTEEWLLKFGFDKRPMSMAIIINNYNLLQLSVCNDKGKGEFYAIINQDNQIIALPKRVFYVHQLQNLFFVLAGKELIHEK